jgi:RNA polymerase sigma factor (sigma-70 family)
VEVHMNGANTSVIDNRQFFEQHSGELYESLFRQVIKLTRNRRDAEDITQSAFMKVLEQMQRPNWKIDTKSIRAYLGQTARNLHRDRWRSKSKTISYDDKDVRETIEQQAAVNDDSVARMDNRIYYKELFEALPNVILKDSTDYERQLLQLRKVDQLPWEEIAEIVGRSVNQVRYDLHKLEARLRYRVARITEAGTQK